MLFLEDKVPALLKAFVNFGNNVGRDADAHMFFSVAIGQGMRIGALELDYAKPVANAPIFDDFLVIPDAIADSTGVKSLTNLTLALNGINPQGLRQTYWTITFKLDEELLAFATDICFEEIAKLQAMVYSSACTYQLITTPALERMFRKGGNPLGLSPELGPLVILQPNTMWNYSLADEKIHAVSKSILDRTNAEAKRRGLHVDYIYMNYASEHQLKEVVPAYGSANHQRLKKIAAKYDPTGVFQTLQPGYFKL